MSRETDSAALIRFIQSNQFSFQNIVETYQAKAFRLMLRITKNIDDAEDALQDAFLNIFSKLHTFRNQSALSSWIYRVAANAALMRVRTRNKHNLSCDSEKALTTHLYWEKTHETSSETGSNDDNELRDYIITALQGLPPEYQNIFILREFDQCTPKEISDITGASVSAVKSKLHRARMILRKKLSPVYNDYFSESQYKDSDDED